MTDKANQLNDAGGDSPGDPGTEDNVVARGLSLLAASRPWILLVGIFFGLSAVNHCVRLALGFRAAMQLGRPLGLQVAVALSLVLLSEVIMASVYAVLCFRLLKYASAIRLFSRRGPAELAALSRAHNALWLFAAVAIGLLLLSTLASKGYEEYLRWGAESRPPQTAGRVLVYEIDRESVTGNGAIDMRAVIGAISCRINLERLKRAELRPGVDQRIEILVYGTDPKEFQRIERLLCRPGTLEFRILANMRDHKSIIEEAKAAESDVIRDSGGEVRAQWFPVPPHSDLVRFSYTDIVTRTVPNHEGHNLEVLVVKDSYDVTGQYLIRAFPELDIKGRPCVVLQFDEEGATRLADLTSRNLSDPSGGFKRYLGVILNGEVLFAPSIEEPLSDTATIGGDLSVDQLIEMVDMLNAASLPVKLKPVRVASPASG